MLFVDSTLALNVLQPYLLIWKMKRMTDYFNPFILKWFLRDPIQHVKVLCKVKSIRTGALVNR